MIYSYLMIYSRYFMEDLCGLGHVTGLELYDLHDLAHSSGLDLCSIDTDPTQHILPTDTGCAVDDVQ